MSDVQKEASTAFSMGSRYKQINAVFMQMPMRFRMPELMAAAGIKDSMQVRAAIASILYRDFKCINVGIGYKRCWKKPEVEI